MKKKRALTVMIVFLLLVGSGLTGCTGGETAVTHNHPMAPLEDMPAQVQDSGRKIRETYQFATANPELTDAIPCYCGCVGLGHTSSYDCYVAGLDETGVTQFDDHAEYCSICNDITLDTMRMLDEGKTAPEIFAQIEMDYARFGPPTEKLENGESQ
jgi:hypothetical protein